MQTTFLFLRCFLLIFLRVANFGVGIEPLVKSFNAEFTEFLYLNSPDFDFMCVIEGESDKDIASACNLIYASGSFSMINWFRAFESSEWKEVYEIASKNMANYVSAKQAAEN